MSEVKEEVVEGVIWEPDSCDCQIVFVYEPQAGIFRCVKVLKKCALHKDSIDEQDHFEKVLAHNRSFNLKVFDATNSDNDMKLRKEAKRVEKERSKGV